MTIDIFGDEFDPQIMPSMQFHMAIALAGDAAGLRDSTDPAVGMMAGHGSTMVLVYASAETYAAREKTDTDAFRTLIGFALTKVASPGPRPHTVVMRFEPIPGAAPVLSPPKPD